MLLELQVTWLGTNWSLAWKDGELTGDPPVVEHVLRMAEVSSIGVANYPLRRGSEILEDANAFYQFCHSRLFNRQVVILSGELPPLVSEPAGGIA